MHSGTSNPHRIRLNYLQSAMPPTTTQFLPGHSPLPWGRGWLRERESIGSFLQRNIVNMLSSSHWCVLNSLHLALFVLVSLNNSWTCLVLDLCSQCWSKYDECLPRWTSTQWRRLWLKSFILHCCNYRIITVLKRKNEKKRKNN